MEGNVRKNIQRTERLSLAISGLKEKKQKEKCGVVIPSQGCISTLSLLQFFHFNIKK